MLVLLAFVHISLPARAPEWTVIARGLVLVLCRSLTCATASVCGDFPLELRFRHRALMNRYCIQDQAHHLGNFSPFYVKWKIFAGALEV